MNIVDYLKMEPKEMHISLAYQIETDPTKSEKIIKDLLESYKYIEDSTFKNVVDMGNILLSYIKGDSIDLVPACTELVEKTKLDGEWFLYVANQRLLGACYQRLGLLEKALECYRHVINTETERESYYYISNAYDNIGLIYESLQDYDNALKYVKLAIDLSEQIGEKNPYLNSDLLMFKSDYAIILCNLNRTGEVAEIIDELNRVDKTQVSLISKFSYYIALMNYYFNMGDYEKAKSVFIENKDLISDINERFKIGLIEIFIGLCEEFSMPIDFYLDELLAAYENIGNFSLEGEVSVYRCLRAYYLETGQKDRAIQITNSYIKSLDKKEKAFLNKRKVSLALVNQLISECQNLSHIESKNTELEKVLADGNRHKKALQEVYQRIELINELGKRVTSSLNLATVIEMTFNNLCDTIHIDAFLIAVAEPEFNRLRSVAYYYDKILQPNFCADLDTKDSLFVECYNTKKTILSEDVHEDERFKHIHLTERLDEIKAGIFIPLRIGEQLVGVMAVKSKEKGTYNYDHIMLLEGLVPYLSIALNNAIYSEKLEREIKAHLETQAELRKANDKLEALSSMDGLTRISNRRDFETKIRKLISNADEKNESVAVIMVDIDNFKLYNDNYGHLAGDEALKVVAQVIRENLDRVDGLSARFGGEEFVCACSGLSLEQITELAEKLCKDVYAKGIEHIKVKTGIMSISVGVAITKNCNVNRKSELMKQADISLYEAKNTGKNRAIVKEIL